MWLCLEYLVFELVVVLGMVAKCDRLWCALSCSLGKDCSLHGQIWHFVKKWSHCYEFLASHLLLIIFENVRNYRMGNIWKAPSPAFVSPE